jgi:HSP20 family protein
MSDKRLPEGTRFSDVFRALGSIVRLVDEALKVGEAAQAGEVRDILGVKGGYVRYNLSVKTLADNEVIQGIHPSRKSRNVGSITKGEEREPVVDVFDEGEHLTLVTELQGVGKDDIDIRTVDDKLIISVDKPSRKYYREIPLPATVRPERIEARYRNGVLQVRVHKTRQFGDNAGDNGALRGRTK